MAKAAHATHARPARWPLKPNSLDYVSVLPKQRKLGKIHGSFGASLEAWINIAWHGREVMDFLEFLFGGFCFLGVLELSARQRHRELVTTLNSLETSLSAIEDNTDPLLDHKIQETRRQLRDQFPDIADEFNDEYAAIVYGTITNERLLVQMIKSGSVTKDGFIPMADTLANQNIDRLIDRSPQTIKTTLNKLEKDDVHQRFKKIRALVR
jgi:hypothetical protein